MSKTERQSAVEALTEKLKGSATLYVTDFSAARVTKYGAPPLRPSFTGAATIPTANDNNPIVRGSAKNAELT